MNREYKNYLRRCRRLRPEVKAKERQYVETYKKNHPDYVEKHRLSDKKYYETHRSQRLRSINNNNNRSCKDPVAGDVCRYNTLVARKRNHPEWYKDVILKDCIIKTPRIIGLDDTLRQEYNL